jgi:hypothetical protein
VHRDDLSIRTAFFMVCGCRSGLRTSGSLRKGQEALRLSDILRGRQGFRGRQEMFLAVIRATDRETALLAPARYAAGPGAHHASTHYRNKRQQFRAGSLCKLLSGGELNFKREHHQMISATMAAASGNGAGDYKNPSRSNDRTALQMEPWVLEIRPALISLRQRWP